MSVYHSKSIQFNGLKSVHTIEHIQTPALPQSDTDGGEGKKHSWMLVTPQRTYKFAGANTRHQPLNPRPQTLYPIPQTPKPQPQNPDPRSQTPNPKPQTPNSKSQTPNPKPQIPNPKLQTPNPKSQTLNAASDAEGAEAWVGALRSCIHDATVLHAVNSALLPLDPEPCTPNPGP
jgi:hypothetical protein